MSHHDVIVIGAGPAGLSAAACLAEMGLDVICLDEQATIGGQIYRNIRGASQDLRTLLGEDYTRGESLAKRFIESGARYEPYAMVWQVEPDGHICYSRDGKSKQIRANYIIAATGAMERPMPVPGWTLPGVMGAGAANNLAKEAGLTPEGRVVLAGSGPLLLLEASLLIRKKVNIQAILETTPATPAPKAIVRAPEAAVRADFLWKGLSLVREIKKAGIPHYKGVTQIKALGNDKVTRVEAQHKEEALSFDIDMLLLHFGVIPNTHIYRQAGCDMVWEPEQRYWYPKCDAWGRTTRERIFAAGDGAKVGGALAAQYKGELAALEAARCSGIIPEYERDRLAEPLLKALRHDRWPRPFVDALYAPRPDQLVFDEDTVVCRCENLTVGDIRQMVKEGIKEVNEIKSISRAGMGPCQGRMCGPAVAEIVAAETSATPDRAGLVNVRPPLKPVPLEEVAAMELDQGATADNWLLGKK